VSNPFSASFLEPGRIKFVFGDLSSIDTLAERLANQGGLGQIIGPHGSGKSTLLVQLFETLRDHTVCRQTRLRSESDSPLVSHQLGQLGAKSQLFIDGFEQAKPKIRRRWIEQAKLQRVGLVVTSHQDVGLPLLYQTRPSLDLFRKVVQQFVAPIRLDLEETATEQAFIKALGDCREALFHLYDLVEKRCYGTSVSENE
jgi:hypothetical protein